MVRSARAASWSVLAAAVGITAAPGRAAAQAAPASDFPIERLHIALDRAGVLDVEWGDVLPHLSWDAGIWLTGEDDPLVVVDAATGERLGSLVDSRVGGSLMVTFGLWDRFQLGVEAPLIVYQSRDGSIDGVTPMGMTLPALGSLGLGDLRVNGKVRLLRSESGATALSFGLAVVMPTGGATDYRGEDGVALSPHLAMSHAAGGLRWAANVGYWYRDDSRILDQIVEDELFARTGVGYRFRDADPKAAPVELDLSLGAATSAAAPFAAANQTALELLGQVVYSLGGRTLVFAGGGVGLNEGYGTPDWRVFVGTRIGVTNDDPDGDGLLGASDYCPRKAEDRDEWEDSDGCPDPDNDEDGVLDVADGAPNDPEDKDEFEDADGVPDPDNDKDQIADGDDRCPLVAETVNAFEDADGCPDAQPDPDGDGLVGTADKCPEVAEDKDAFADEDGCPDPDNDEDGVLDGDDRCALEFGVKENAGCPDTDRDGDTVVDRLDNCPDVAGSPRHQGCKQKQLAVITETGISIIDTVYFKLDKDIIEQRSFKLLDNVAAVIIAHPDAGVIVVEGHTDNQGNDAYNKDLSARRAAAVVTYLVAKGVPGERLRALGFGEEKPLDSNATKAGRAKNRRVEFKILGKGDGIEQENSGPGADTVEK